MLFNIFANFYKDYLKRINYKKAYKKYKDIELRNKERIFLKNLKNTYFNFYTFIFNHFSWYKDIIFITKIKLCQIKY